jgi:hypothetical protein
MPINTRFPHWPIPYKKEVDATPGAPYILTQSFTSKFPALSFEKTMKYREIRYHKYRQGPFHIYYGFEQQFSLVQHEMRLPGNQFTMTTSCEQSSSCRFLHDGDDTTIWSSIEKQQKDQWLRIDFDSAKKVSSIALFHLPKSSASPVKFKVEGLSNTRGGKEWYTLQDNVKSTTERLRFFNDHPVYHGLSQQVKIIPELVSALRITVVDPAQNRIWALSEIEINVLKEN